MTDPAASTNASGRSSRGGVVWRIIPLQWLCAWGLLLIILGVGNGFMVRLPLLMRLGITSALLSLAMGFLTPLLSRLTSRSADDSAPADMDVSIH